MHATEQQRREVMERLLRVWQANPHLRLGQLLHHATHGVDVSYLFDEELVELMEQYLPKKPTLVSRRDAPTPV